MFNNKIFILLPDGIGLRNFAYSSFYEIGKNQDFDAVFWNNTPFPLTDLGFQEIKIENAKPNPLTDIYKNIKIQAELNLNIKKTKDKVYNTYRFPFSYSTLKIAAKSILIQVLTGFYDTDKGLGKIREKMNRYERKTLFYKQSLETLQKEKPSLVFCTNQRPLIAIAPLLAAQDLGIPTATFIFSWDNLPKATMVVETDYYFVWSTYMKKELQFYYPNIKSEAIFITGTPQFEVHFEKNKILSRELFCEQNKLDINRKYICFSGDDSITSPDDPQYLEDLANAISILNEKGKNLGIIFRRCPVDFSNRYDSIIKEYSDVIVSIDPLWKPLTSSWNAILPTSADNQLLSNLAEHCEMVLNVGSSMVFDFISHNKPCCYFRYNQKYQVNKKWDIFKCYRFVHFRSMPNEASIVWLNNANEIASKIEKTLEDSNATVKHAKDWFKVINQDPPEEASKRIWDSIKTIIS
ncbi:UDP-glycosyltransferase [Flavobacterium sp. WC2416]|uniref:UDP-glycosyltransferase n=1 Tax=Flavobacterium sp. WC2416 TaxID=3234141 RepID=A0AB39W9F1_9FLAO